MIKLQAAATTVVVPAAEIKGATKMNKQISIAIILISLFFSGLQAQAQAQSQGQAHNQANAQQNPTRSQTEFQSQTLKQMVELPEVPQYTGHMSFVTGTLFPNATSGASLTLQLKSTEYCEQIRDWYQASLQQSGWKLDKPMCNDHTVAAWKNKNLVQIIIRSNAYKNSRSDVIIRYRYGS